MKFRKKIFGGQIASFYGTIYHKMNVSILRPFVAIVKNCSMRGIRGKDEPAVKWVDRRQVSEFDPFPCTVTVFARLHNPRVGLFSIGKI